MIYNELDGLKYIMEKKEIEKKENQFPHIPKGYNSYADLYRTIEAKMNSEVHVHVVAGAAGAGDGILNDHGVEHIAMVQERAYNVLKDRVEELSGYEIFFLLLAIHFHDVGNITGRDKHEEKIMDIFETLGESLPLDMPSRRTITSIAMAHGGSVDGDKDTLAYVEEKEYINGLPIRNSVLASVLRFADEIADDKNRVSDFMIKAKAIPDANRVFHIYSSSLEPPAFEGNTIKLIYNIDYKYINETITKLDKEVYLYDEILSRIKKCLCELDYCRKYSQGFIGISCLSVQINVMGKNPLSRFIHSENFRIRIGGYPDSSIYNVDNWPSEDIGAKSAEQLKKIILRKEEEKNDG